MAATTYTGNGGTQAVSNAVNGVSFQPDFVWLKSRSNAYTHKLYDSVRGITKKLESDSTAAEITTDSTFLTSINSGGFTVGSDTGINGSGSTFVGWQWKAGGTAVSNTAGSITSSVSANTTAGFSVVTYTGTGAVGATVGHGLGVAPSLIIQKPRSAGTSDDNWHVYHSSIGATGALSLNTTSGTSTSAVWWNNTAPTSTVFTVGGSGAAGYTNNSGSTYLAYCFAAVAGYSAFGSYTGNGSADGTFVYLGFRPRFILAKASSAVADWVIVDTARDTYNGMQNQLFPNLSNAESTGTVRFDALSNGFKLRVAGDPNNSGVTYIYMAFAETAFKFSNAR
jgi:hypothetical protein